MIIKSDSLLCRVLRALPMWLPYRLQSVRVGGDVRSYVSVQLHK